MTDQTRLSEPTFSEAAAPSVEAVILAPRIVAFYVEGYPAKCGNDPRSSGPRFLYTHTVDDTPEALNAFTADHPTAVRKQELRAKANCKCLPVHLNSIWIADF